MIFNKEAQAGREYFRLAEDSEILKCVKTDDYPHYSRRIATTVPRILRKLKFLRM